MSEQQNVEILRRGYALWNDTKANSVAHWLDLIADDVQWRSLADGATGMEFTGACDGKPDVQRYFADLGGQWAMNYYTVEEFIAQGDRVVMVGRCGWRNKKTGATVDTPKVDIIRMRDSRIVGFFELYDTAKALAAARGATATTASKVQKPPKAQKGRKAAKPATSKKSAKSRKSRKAAKRKPAKARKSR
jgi:ketosteroid isomerase-like protein